MNHTSTLRRVHWILTAVLSLAAAVIGGCAMWTSFDAEIGYFDPGVLSTAMPVVAALAVVAAVLPPLLIKRKAILPACPPADAPIATRCLSFLLAFQAAFYGISTCIRRPPLPDTSTFVLVGALGAIGAALYFVFSALRISARWSSIVAPLLGLCPIVWGVSIIGETYFDMTVTMNSPIKLATQFGFATLMLIMTAEIRLYLREPASRLAMAIRGLTAFVGLGAGTMLIVSIGVLRDFTQLLHGVSLLLIGLFALVRLADDAFAPLPAVDTARSSNENATDENDADENVIDADAAPAADEA